MGPADPQRPRQASTDELEIGWGDDLADRDTDDEERLNAERPPHHDRD